MRLYIILCSVVINTLSLFTAHSQTLPTWEKTGMPYGGTAETITVCASWDLFARIRFGGLYISDDQGNFWTEIEHADDFIAICSNAAGSMYAMTSEEVFHSTDNGQSWIDVTPEEHDGSALAITMDPDNGLLFLGTGNGNPTLFLKRNESDIWNALAEFNENLRPLCTVSPAGDILLLGSNGPIGSTDDGSTWQRGTGFGELPDTKEMERMYADASGTFYCGGKNALFASKDRGASWSDVLSLKAGETATSFVMTHNGKVVLGISSPYIPGPKLLSSIDSGETWVEISHDLEEKREHFLLLAAQGDYIFARGFRNGLYRSTDLGRQWLPSCRGIGNSYISKLASSEGIGLYALSPCSFHYSTDEGAEWHSRPLPGNEDFGIVTDFLSDSRGYVYVSSDDGIRITTDNGLGWIERTQKGPLCIGIEDRLYNSTGTAVQMSADLGETWSSVLAKQADKLAASFNGVLVAAALYGRFHVSADTGRTWVQRQIPFEYARDNASSLFITLAGTILADYSPQQDRVLARSTDLGETWSPVNINGIVQNFVQTGSGTIYALVEVRIFPRNYLGVYSSSDDGLTWKSTAKGLPPDDVSDIAAGTYNLAFVSTRNDGVFTNTGPLLSTGRVSESAAGFSLQGHYPEPVSDLVSISVSNTSVTSARLILFDVLGRPVLQYNYGELAPGQHMLQLRTGGLPSGLYFYRFDGTAAAGFRKLTILHR